MTGAPTAAAVERIGSIGLRFAFAAGLGVVALVAARSPDLFPALPVALAAGGAGILLLHHPLAHLASVILMGVALSGRGAGVQFGEIAFVVWAFAFVVVWYTARWHRREPFVRSRSDLAAALFLVFGVGGGAVLGIINGSPFVHFRAEVVACLPLFLYFPIKEVVRTRRSGALVVALCTIALGLYAVARNGFLMQQALSNADQIWKIADVRYNYGETFLAASLLIALALLSTVRKRSAQVALLGVMGLLVAGLLLTKSRAFWVATCLGFAIVAYLFGSSARKRMLAFAIVGGLSFVVIASLIFGDYLALLVTGIVRRFSTLATATTDDVSLVNRFVETDAVMNRIWQNPIVGYGWGAPVSYYSLVQIATVDVAFIHNGYVALWLKVGLWGLGLMLALWAGALSSARRAARAVELTAVERAIAAGAGGTLITFSIAALTSNPFTIPDQLLAVTLVLGILHGLAQRADSRELVPRADAG